MKEFLYLVRFYDIADMFNPNQIDPPFLLYYYGYFNVDGVKYDYRDLNYEQTKTFIYDEEEFLVPMTVKRSTDFKEGDKFVVVTDRYFDYIHLVDCPIILEYLRNNDIEGLADRIGMGDVKIKEILFCVSDEEDPTLLNKIMEK